MMEQSRAKSESSPSVLSELLAELRLGRWVFAALEPLFKSSLLAKQPGAIENASTTRLSASHYRNEDLVELNHSKPALVRASGLNNQQSNFWNKAVRTVSDNAELWVSNDGLEPRLNDCLSIIGKHAPDTEDFLQKHISYICPIKTTAFRSASHPHYFGCIFIAGNLDAEAMAISLVHEMAHQELFLLNLVDRLIQSSCDFRLAHSPYQEKSRPPIGRLHSAHALFRMIQLEKEFRPEKVAKHKLLLEETVSSFDRNETTAFAWAVLNEVY